MAYTPEITNASLPDDTVIAETAQAEFRVIKSKGKWTLYRRSSQIDIVNTIAVTDLIPAYTVAAGILLTSKRLRLRLEGIYLNNTGASRTFLISIKYDVQLVCHVTVTVPSDVDFGAWEMDVEFGTWDTNAAKQEAFGKIIFYTPPSSAGEFNSPAFSGGSSNTAMTVNSAIARNLTATVQMSIANVGLGIDVNYANISFY